MSELKKCFAALGFTELPATEQEVEEQYARRMENYKDSTESHRLTRQLLRENRDQCLAALRKA